AGPAHGHFPGDAPVRAAHGPVQGDDGLAAGAGGAQVDRAGQGGADEAAADRGTGRLPPLAEAGEHAEPETDRRGADDPVFRGSVPGAGAGLTSEFERSTAAG